MHIVIADRFGCSPVEVLSWPETVMSDVLLYLAAEGTGGAARRNMRGM